MKNIGFFLFIGIVLIIFACKLDPKVEPNFVFGKKGLYILTASENDTKSSITYYDKSTKTLTENFFQKANQKTTEDQKIIDIKIADTIAFISLNNSSDIVIANKNTLIETERFTNIAASPQFFAYTSTKTDTTLYISDWGGEGLAPGIVVFDLNKKEVKQKIFLGTNPGPIEIINQQLFVGFNGPFTGNENKLYIVSLKDYTVSEATVGANPHRLLIHNSDSLLIGCYGQDSKTTKVGGSVYVYNPQKTKEPRLIYKAKVPGLNALTYKPGSQFFLMNIESKTTFAAESKGQLNIGNITVAEGKDYINLFYDIDNNRLHGIGENDDDTGSGIIDQIEIPLYDSFKFSDLTIENTIQTKGIPQNIVLL